MPRRGERKYTTMMLYPAMNTLTKNVPNRYLRAAPVRSWRTPSWRGST